MQNENKSVNMLAYWEEEFPVSIQRAENTCSITCISWTEADINNSLGETGWLATGSSDGEVGVTSTSTIPHGKVTGRKGTVMGSYILQHLHHNEIAFVKFSKQMDYLASCDTQGILCVWAFAQKRWICKCKFDALGNVNSRVTNLIWGNQVLCLISHPGVVTIFCPITWHATTFLLGFETGHGQVHVTISPCNGFIYVGTYQGAIQIIDLTGTTTYHLRQVECSIVQICCSQENTIAIGFLDGVVILMRNKDNERLLYRELDTTFKSYLLAWSESINYLAILGVRQERTHLELYSQAGVLLINLTVPEHIKACTQKTLAMTWGHGDGRIFVTTGAYIAVVRVVSYNSTNLKEMSSIKVYTNGWKSIIMSSQTLPSSMKLMLKNLMTNTIYDPISFNCTSLKDFNIRAVETAGSCIYCTMKHNKLEKLYTLYLEHVGKIVPLLEARQIGCIRPKFVIYDMLATDVKAREDDTSTSGKHILAKVHSNLWGTKFAILPTGLNKKCLAQVKYKASLIHWQPRKITLRVPHPDKVETSLTASDLLKDQPTNKHSMQVGEDTENCVKLHNCSPQWNSEYSVFQLDCGGRVIIESEKNFKFYFSGFQALQFGRVGDDSYTLDFNYPFSAVQAFGIALSSLTHRLK